MVIRGQELEKQEMKEPRGGKGTAARMAYDAACGFEGEITNFALMVLDPKSEIGYHKHEGDMELYLILDGIAKTNDNGTFEILMPGDMLVTKEGESHSLINETNDPVSFLAVIIKH